MEIFLRCLFIFVICIRHGKADGGYTKYNVNGMTLYLSDFVDTYKRGQTRCRLLTTLKENVYPFEAETNQWANRIINFLHANKIYDDIWFPSIRIQEYYGDYRFFWLTEEVEDWFWLSRIGTDYETEEMVLYILEPDGDGECTFLTKTGRYSALVTSTGKHMLADSACYQFQARTLCSGFPISDATEEGHTDIISSNYYHGGLATSNLWLPGDVTVFSGAFEDSATELSTVEIPDMVPFKTQEANIDGHLSLYPSQQLLDSSDATETDTIIKLSKTPSDIYLTRTRSSEEVTAFLGAFYDSDTELSTLTQSYPMTVGISDIIPFKTHETILDDHSTSYPRQQFVVGGSDLIETENVATMTPSDIDLTSTPSSSSYEQPATSAMGNVTTKPPPTTDYIKENQNTRRRTTSDTVPVISCPCKCVVNQTKNYNMTDDKMTKIISDIESELIMEVTNMSSTVRRKMSAQDSRVSSSFAGAIGICFLILVNVAIVAMDVNRIISKI